MFNYTFLHFHDFFIAILYFDWIQKNNSTHNSINNYKNFPLKWVYKIQKPLIIFEVINVFDIK